MSIFRKRPHDHDRSYGSDPNCKKCRDGMESVRAAVECHRMEAQFDEGGSPTRTGYVPQVGEHVFCFRPEDGSSMCGVVRSNRRSLVLSMCQGMNWSAALTPDWWNVTPMDPVPSCHKGGGLL